MKVVEHKIFQRGILIAILFNTLSMGIEYHNQVTNNLTDYLTFLLRTFMLMTYVQLTTFILNCNAMTSGKQGAGG